MPDPNEKITPGQMESAKEYLPPDMDDNQKDEIVNKLNEFMQLFREELLVELGKAALPEINIIDNN